MHVLEKRNLDMLGHLADRRRHKSVDELRPPGFRGLRRRLRNLWLQHHRHFDLLVDVLNRLNLSMLGRVVGRRPRNLSLYRHSRRGNLVDVLRLQSLDILGWAPVVRTALRPRGPP